MTTAKYDEMVESLSDMMDEAFRLSLDVSHSEIAPGGYWFTARQETLGTEEETDMVWAWADGHMHKLLETRTSGKCSLQAMIDFDISKFEERVKADIVTMKRLLEKFGKPIQLDVAEMKRRGYHGKWAGDND